MKKVNKKGFTLVELLATLVILGLLTVIAAPNIIGILTNTKLNTYISDANKLQTLAEYKFRSDSKITRPQDGQCIVLTMNYLGTSEFKNPPYGGTYSTDKSFVVIKGEKNAQGALEYKYYVQIIEEIKTGTEYGGIKQTIKSEIKKENNVDLVETGMSSSNLPTTGTDMALDANGTNKTSCSTIRNTY
ncbi:MAG: type II secretion system protein [Bacilli bacterium]|nr:type II secretion system protein [Bacilli bacterium]